MSTIAVLGTFDTKGLEHAYTAERIRERGHDVEALIQSGAVDGALDVTTTEWADELVGGILAINDPAFADACVAALLDNMRTLSETR